ncbi:Riboflavin transporter FmnP [Caminicella sporogenes DSM 14501]|uniref:Riboflavin transporter n=1 Tax=Caminicella sporogenes DSM 14501 TaxID=1121266 RepID=A0A1M6Q5H8_9FIRM|nr:ECF transporter S component [Caminicella sporogenes]RKD23579.1 ECF transporter S component [Caminicella sporogenes]SHK15383.1 Riboflavin transporter FmnP [Caminicella sporogenes DSM 14501]
MSEKVNFRKERIFNFKEILKISNMVKISFLSVLSFIIMLIEIPVPFFPGFLKIDLSDVPALVAGFTLGPIGGILVEFIKNLLHFIIKTDTGGVGEFANFLIGIALVIPSATMYRIKRVRKMAFLGMGLGIILMGIVGALANYYILIPFYAKMMPIEQIIAWSSAANGAIRDLKTLILYGILPFNIIKGIVIVIFTSAIYKKISHLFV